MKYKRLSIDDARLLVKKPIINLGIKKEYADLIVNDYLSAELGNKKTHGLIKFYKEFVFYKKRLGNPKIIKKQFGLALVDANKEIGQISALFSINILIKLTKKYGIAAVGMTNTQRYGSLSMWVDIIAKNGFIGLLFNTSESAAAPYNGIEPILGTNPLAIAIPTAKDNLILDMSTSKKSMGEILKATYYGDKLPNNSFLNSKGKYTNNINDVNSVEIFGDYKGFGLSLIIEILTGSLITAKMGKAKKNQFDAGYLFIGIDPSFFQNINKFKKENYQLIDSIYKSKTKNNESKIQIPGIKRNNEINKNLNKGFIEIPIRLYNDLKELN